MRYRATTFYTFWSMVNLLSTLIWPRKRRCQLGGTFRFLPVLPLVVALSWLTRSRFFIIPIDSSCLVAIMWYGCVDRLRCHISPGVFLGDKLIGGCGNRWKHLDINVDVYYIKIHFLNFQFKPIFYFLLM